MLIALHILLSQPIHPVWKNLARKLRVGYKDIIGYYAEDIKDSSHLPGFSPTAASAQSVQVEGSRWERSNECKDAGHDPH